MKDNACKWTEKPEKPIANAVKAKLSADDSTAVFDSMLDALPISIKGRITAYNSVSPRSVRRRPQKQAKKVRYEQTLRVPRPADPIEPVREKLGRKYVWHVDCILLFIPNSAPMMIADKTIMK